MLKQLLDDKQHIEILYRLGSGLPNLYKHEHPHLSGKLPPDISNNTPSNKHLLFQQTQQHSHQQQGCSCQHRQAYSF